MAIRFTVGGSLRFSTSENNTAYGVMLNVRPYMAFYRESSVDEAAGQSSDDPMFIVAVHNSAYSKGRWGDFVGKVPSASLPAIPPFFRQNAMNSYDCTISYVDGTQNKASPLECVGLERSAVWEATHIESRIDDFYAGRPNEFVESSKVKL